MMQWPPKDSSITIRPLTNEEAQRIDKVLKEPLGCDASGSLCSIAVVPNSTACTKKPARQQEHGVDVSRERV